MTAFRQRWDADDALRRCVLGSTVVIIVFLVVVPLGFLLYGSVHMGIPGDAGAYSLRKFVDVVTTARTYRLLFTSTIYAAGSTLVAFAIGGLLVWFVQRTDLPAKGAFIFFALFPLFLPPVLLSVAWSLVLDPQIGLLNVAIKKLAGIDAPFNVNTLPGMIWIGGMLEVPLVFLWLWPAFAAMDPMLEEAAAMSKASPLTVIRTITLPISLPAIAAVFLISFVLSIEDVTVPIVVGLPSHINVIASEIYLAYIRVPTDLHAASVYAVVLLSITAALMLCYRRLTSHTERYVTVRGRGYRPSTFALGRSRTPTTLLLVVLLLVIVGLPTFILLWTALSPYLQVPSMAGLRTLSLRWFVALFDDPAAMRGLVNTTVLGLGVAVVVTVLAVVVGWVEIRTRMRFRRALDVITFLPIAIPGLVVGLSLMWLYLSIPVPIYGTLWILGIAFATRFLPYGVRLTYSGFSQIHKELEEAALVAGSGWAKTLRTISCPLLAPTLVVGVIYTVLRCFREFSSSILLSTFGNESYSVVAYHMWDGGETSKAAAYGVVAMVVMTVVVVIAQRATSARGFAE